MAVDGIPGDTVANTYFSSPGGAQILGPRAWIPSKPGDIFGDAYINFSTEVVVSVCSNMHVSVCIHL